MEYIISIFYVSENNFYYVRIYSKTDIYRKKIFSKYRKYFKKYFFKNNFVLTLSNLSN